MLISLEKRIAVRLFVQKAEKIWLFMWYWSVVHLIDNWIIVCYIWDIIWNQEDYVGLMAVNEDLW